MLRLPTPSLLGLIILNAVPAVQAVDFKTQILPIFEKKCLECHSAPKMVDGRRKNPKGDLRLDAAWAMLKGAENGPTLVPGNLAKSYLFEVVNLPKDDDMFMPPEGDPLSAAEIALLKSWIEEGAPFGEWKGNLEGAPAEVLAAKPAAPKGPREHELLYAELSKTLKAADPAALEAAKAKGAQVFQLKADSPLLRVDFLTGVSRCNDESLQSLKDLAANIAQLDLGRTVISNEGLKALAGFKSLISLDLRQTKIDNSGLVHLAALKQLRHLNLFGTQVSAEGLQALSALKNLRSLNLYQTQVKPGALAQLKSLLPKAEIVLQ